jgi:hypothetical protein
MLILLVRGISEVRHRYWLKWHDVRAYTKFHEDRLKHLINIRVIAATILRHCNVGTTERRDLRSMPLRCLHVL